MSIVNDEQDKMGTLVNVPQAMTDSPRAETEKEKTKRIYEAAIETEDKEASRRLGMFVVICFLEMLANFDSGILPATIKEVQESFTPVMDDREAGLAGR
mmetsp:Transcript_14556/g.32056  ORF Transcript_14556/g.32056 Transcript_14556/m.32056 type:complete len:99 (+) Transcript_14556:105-401(+)